MVRHVPLEAVEVIQKWAIVVLLVNFKKTFLLFYFSTLHAARHLPTTVGLVLMFHSIHVLILYCDDEFEPENAALSR